MSRKTLREQVTAARPPRRSPTLAQPRPASTTAPTSGATFDFQGLSLHPPGVTHREIPVQILDALARAASRGEHQLGHQLARATEAEKTRAHGLDPSPEYSKALREAVDLMRNVQFAMVADGKPGYTSTGDRYDSDWWEERPVVSNGQINDVVLVLKKGRSPSEAIDALFLHPEKWALDCARFVQVAHWYAMNKTQGKRFDKYIKEFNEFYKRPGFVLMSHLSTGMEQADVYKMPAVKQGNKNLSGVRTSASGQMVDYNELLKKIPIVSRVCWTNLHQENPDIRTENALKLDTNLFGAHGMGVVGDKNTFTREEIEKVMALQTYDTTKDPDYDPNTGALTEGLKSYINDFVLVTEIEIYNALIMGGTVR